MIKLCENECNIPEKYIVAQNIGVIVIFRGFLGTSPTRSKMNNDQKGKIESHINRENRGKSAVFNAVSCSFALGT